MAKDFGYFCDNEAVRVRFEKLESVEDFALALVGVVAKYSYSKESKNDVSLPSRGVIVNTPLSDCLAVAKALIERLEDMERESND